MRKHHSTLGGVALALALTLTGCGGDDTDPTVQDTPSQSPPPTPTSTPTSKTPEEKAAAQLTKYLDVRDTRRTESATSTSRRSTPSLRVTSSCSCSTSSPA